jgi:hypothetical protein
MANTLSTLVVRMAADIGQFQSDMGRAVHQAEATSRKISSAFSTIGRVANAAIAGISFQEVTRRTADAERVINRLNSALKTTGFSAGVTAAEINEMAEQLKRSTPFDDDEIRRGIAGLLRFRDIQGDVFREAVRLAPDLAVALDTDVASAFQKIGRALQDPIAGMKGLREAGVKLSEQQLELAKRFQNTGDLASAQRVAIDAMSKSFGGAAGGENTGLVKSMKDVEKAYDDLLKTIGKTAGFQSGVTSFYGFLEQSLRDIETIINRGDWVEKLLATAAFAAGFRGFQLSDQNPEPKSRPIRGAVTEETLARIGELQRQIERAQENAAKRAREAQERAIVIGKTNAESQIELERDLAKQREAIIDEFNSQNLLSISRYYDLRRGVIEQKLQAELQANKDQQRGAAIAFQEADQKGDLDKRNQAEAQLIKLSFERERIQRDASSQYILLTLKETEATKKFEDQIRDVNIQLQEIQGNTVSATAARFNQQFREYRERLIKERGGDSPEVRQLDALKDLTIQNAQFNKIRGDQDIIVQRLQIEEERLQNTFRVGAISEFENLTRTGEARKKAVQQMEAQVVALEEIARISGDLKLTIQAEQARAALESLRMETDLLAQKFDTIFTESFSNAFADFIDGTKSAKDAFRSFANDVVRQINKMVAEALTKQLFQSIGLGGSGGIGTFFAGLFGGGASAGIGYGAAGTAASTAMVATAGGGFVPALAEGTDYVPHDMLAFIHKGEAVIPAGENTSRSPQINITVQGNVDRRTALQIGAEVEMALARSGRNL